MKDTYLNKFFAYTVTILIIVSIIAIIYVAWKFGKDVSNVKGVTDTNMSILEGESVASEYVK